MSPYLRSRSQEHSVTKTPSADQQRRSGREDRHAAHKESFRADESVESITLFGNPIAKTQAILRRSVSDPLDALEDVDEIWKEDQGALTAPPSPDSARRILCLPTLPRFPCVEQQNENCWSEPPINIFRVRGKDYLTAKNKVPSQPYLLRSRGCDLLLTKLNSNDDIAERSLSLLGGTLRKEATLAVNFRFPWGMLMLYYGIPKELEPFMEDPFAKIPSGFSSAQKVFCRWLQGDANYKNERFKLIPYVAEGPWVVRSLVTGTPALIGKKLPVTYHLEPSNDKGNRNKKSLLTVELDIGSSSATAKKIVGVCRRYMNALTVDIGLVIQGNTTGELPEQMMGSTRIHRVDPLKAPTLD